jgi:hypothetical protein
VTGDEHESGVKWIRPPEFEDDLDVVEDYERLLADGEVTLSHEYRTARGDIGNPEDIFWIQKHRAALARRAAEDGFKVRWDPLMDFQQRGVLRRTSEYTYWGRTSVLVLDGPLTAARVGRRKALLGGRPAVNVEPHSRL